MLPLEKLVALRHYLHAHPEVSHQEAQTAQYIENYLHQLKPDQLITGLGGHGVLATFDSGLAGPALLVRCELDALPIEEINSFAHRSLIPGVSHKCGHDGHMTMVCGLAEMLSQKRPGRGKVHLLFQPAEETGAGARAVLQDPKFAAVKPDMGVALHNVPHAPKHAILLRSGTITAAVCGLIVRLLGRTAHASQPEHGLNPTLALTELLQQSHALNRPNPSETEFALVTSVHVRIGSPAYGVAAGDGEVHLTLRAWDDAKLEGLKTKIVQMAQGLAKRDGLALTSETVEHFHANHNDAALTELVRGVAIENGIRVIELEEGIKGGEDFGLFTAQFPCCMFLLGSGEGMPALHNPDYDFPDDLIETGVRMFEHIVRKVLG